MTPENPLAVGASSIPKLIVVEEGTARYPGGAIVMSAGFSFLFSSETINSQKDGALLALTERAAGLGNPVAFEFSIARGRRWGTSGCKWLKNSVTIKLSIEGAPGDLHFFCNF